MRFKDPERHLEEFWRADPKLRLILADADFYLATFGQELFVTSIFRTQKEQTDLVTLGAARSTYSVHLYGRGADARVFSDVNLNVLLELYINGKYSYDPKNRPHLKTLLRHEGTADHFHFQTMLTEAKK